MKDNRFELYKRFYLFYINIQQHSFTSVNPGPTLFPSSFGVQTILLAVSSPFYILWLGLGLGY